MAVSVTQLWIGTELDHASPYDGDSTKWLHQVMHQNTLFWKHHNLMSLAWIQMILVPMRPHFSLLSSYVLTKKMNRLGIVPGTWFDEKWHFIASNVFFHDILYTIRFVWMRIIQLFYFHYIIYVGKQFLQANTIFLILHYDHDARVM